MLELGEMPTVNEEAEMAKLTESWKGKLARDLLAQACVTGSHGQINVAFPHVDDEAVDTIFYLRGGSQKVLFAQVKSRWASTQVVTAGRFRTQVRRATFRPRDNFRFIFLTCDEELIKLGEILWIVPSKDFKSRTQRQKDSRSTIVFVSKFNSKGDMWKQYRLTRGEAPRKIVETVQANAWGSPTQNT